jgi:cytoskeletal protein RodZ
MKEFFQNLKDKREESGVTLQEIQKKTFLPEKYLNAIESGKMDLLPLGYDRIYLKRYASEIGLDSDEVLRDYDMLSGRLTPYSEKEKTEIEIPPKTFSENKDKQPKPSADKSYSKLDNVNLDKLHKYFWISLAGLIIVVTGFFTYRQYIYETNNQITIKEIPSSQISNNFVSFNSPKVVADTRMQPDSETISSPTIEKENTFVVELKALDTTWIRQIRDGQDTTEYTLPTGLNHRVEAKKEVKFMVGKADGVEFWLNGENLGKMGQTDEVILSLIISEKGIVEKRLKKVNKKSEAKNDSTVAFIPILF